jgi:hypothetical protein
LLAVHGVIEVLAVLLVLDPNLPAPEFTFEDLARNWEVTVGVGVVCGLLRLAAAGGVLANRQWGWALGVIMAVVTFAMLTLYLPAGVADGVLAGGALLCLVVGRFGGQPILVEGG